MRSSLTRLGIVAGAVALAVVFAATTASAESILIATYNFEQTDDPDPGSGQVNCVGVGCASHTGSTTGGTYAGSTFMFNTYPAYNGPQFSVNGFTPGIDSTYMVEVDFALTTVGNGYGPDQFQSLVSLSPAAAIYYAYSESFLGGTPTNPWESIYADPTGFGPGPTNVNNNGATPNPGGTLRFLRSEAYDTFAGYWSTDNFATSTLLWMGSDAAGDFEVCCGAMDFFVGAEGNVTEVRLYDGDPVPEPASMMLFGTGLLGLAYSVRKSRKKNVA